jgi:AcrR family transcriptional regulator
VNKKRSATASRILEAGRMAFNRKGYATTSVTEIAESLGISQGNLTYHFPTKRDLAMAIEEEAFRTMKSRRANMARGSIAEDYVEHLLFGMKLTWKYRFVMRDRMHYAGSPPGSREHSELRADFRELKELLERMKREGLFLHDTGIDIDRLARSVWIVSRYWIDHLQELDDLQEVSWADLKRGIEHHLALVTPLLRASAKRDLEAAWAAAAQGG